MFRCDASWAPRTRVGLWRILGACCILGCKLLDVRAVCVGLFGVFALHSLLKSGDKLVRVRYLIHRTE